LSRFEELSRREAADTAILYAFDLIERDGEDMGNRRFLDRKVALARHLRNTDSGILFNEHLAAPSSSRTPAGWAQTASLQSAWTAPIRPVDVRSGSRSAITPARAMQRVAAFDAPRLKEAVKLCVDVCSDCEKECRKHEQHHAQYKNCADSCAAFIRDGKKVIGAYLPFFLQGAAGVFS
jgi:hypothetical protein